MTPAPAPAQHKPVDAHAIDQPRRRIAELPGPKGLPLLGNVLAFRSPQLHLQLETWHRQFGAFYQVQLGKHRILVVGDHRVIANVLKDRPEGFSRTARLREISVEMGLKPGLFGAEGSDWALQRRMVMASFDPTHVRQYFPALVKVAQRLKRRWAAAAIEHRTIDLQADLMRFTVDTIAGLAFGAEVNTIESDQDVIQQHLDKIFPALFERLVAPLPIWRFWPSRRDRELKRSVLAVNQEVDRLITAARSRLGCDPAVQTQPNNLLEAMILAADRVDASLNDQQIAGNVLTMLLAGEDTTANTIAWMIYLLWQNPLQLSRAREEVKSIVTRPDAPTLDQMAQLTFVEACIQETMRLKPVAPQLPVQALRDTVIGDIEVPAGTVVITLLRTDAVDERWVPQATEFKPERWLNSSPLNKKLSMPFGAGPRICPGRYLAMLEMKIALAMLLAHFELTEVGTAQKHEPQERLSFTMAPVGLRMQLGQAHTPYTEP
jgi:cytochrome P450